MKNMYIQFSLKPPFNVLIVVQTTTSVIQDTVAAFRILNTAIAASRNPEMCANVPWHVYTSKELHGN